MSNNGKNDITIEAGERIAQLVVMKDPKVTIEVKDKLTTTSRNANGFGSTGVTKLGNKLEFHQTPRYLSYNNVQHNTTPMTAAAATMQGGDQEPVCNVDISHDPFNDTQTVAIIVRGNYPTKGLVLEESETWNQRVNITTCKPGTPASKIKNWRKRLKGSTLIKIGNEHITSVAQAQQIFEALPKNEAVDLTIGLVEKLPIHDTNGVPMMYFDQLNTVATHLQKY
jgi:hypothetical protein